MFFFVSHTHTLRPDGYGGFAASYWLNEVHRLAHARGRHAHVSFGFFPGVDNLADRPSRTANGALTVVEAHAVVIPGALVPPTEMGATAGRRSGFRI